jgi:hypothetical protein
MGRCRFRKSRDDLSHAEAALDGIILGQVEGDVKKVGSWTRKANFLGCAGTGCASGSVKVSEKILFLCSNQ